MLKVRQRCLNSAAIPAGVKSVSVRTATGCVMLTTTAWTSTSTTTLIMLMWSTSTARPTVRSIHQRRTTTTARCVWSYLATLGSRSWHQRFCSTCANRVRDDGRGCPICRTDISFVLNLYWSDWTVQLFELFGLDPITNGTDLFLHMAYRPIVHW